MYVRTCGAFRAGYRYRVDVGGQHNSVITGLNISWLISVFSPTSKLRPHNSKKIKAYFSLQLHWLRPPLSPVHFLSINRKRTFNWASVSEPLIDELNVRNPYYVAMYGMGITIFTQIHVGDVIYNDIIIITVR